MEHQFRQDEPQIARVGCQRLRRSVTNDVCVRTLRSSKSHPLPTHAFRNATVASSSRTLDRESRTLRSIIPLVLGIGGITPSAKLASGAGNPFERR
jgi:hypothetical protein